MGRGRHPQPGSDTSAPAWAPPHGLAPGCSHSAWHGAGAQQGWGQQGDPKTPPRGGDFPLRSSLRPRRWPGSRGRIPGSRRLIPSGAGADLGARGCPVAGFGAGDAQLAGSGRHRGVLSPAVCAARAEVGRAAAGCPPSPLVGGTRREAQGHPGCSQPLGQWLRISTAKADPLILLPARQLPWRAPRSASCHPLPCLRPSSQPPARHFPIPAANPGGFPRESLSSPAFPFLPAGTAHPGLCCSQSCPSHPHLLPCRPVPPRCLFPGLGTVSPCRGVTPVLTAPTGEAVAAPSPPWGRIPRFSINPGDTGCAPRSGRARGTPDCSFCSLPAPAEPGWRVLEGYLRFGDLMALSISGASPGGDGSWSGEGAGGWAGSLHHFPGISADCRAPQLSWRSGEGSREGEDTWPRVTSVSPPVTPGLQSSAARPVLPAEDAARRGRQRSARPGGGAGA